MNDVPQDGAVAGGPTYVGFWKRVLATVIDNVILMLVAAPLIWLAYRTGLFAESEAANPLNAENLFMLAVTAAFFILFWRFRGATPGKMLFGARVVDAATLGAPSTGQLVGRYFAYIVSMLPLMLGFLWVAFDRRKQGFHDKLAGTVVIEDENA